MNQLSMSAATRLQLDVKAKLPPLSTQFHLPAAIDTRLGRRVAEGLQLTRASTIALTRLQLALAGGDRRQAMAAIDRLHALDGELEHLVERLPRSSAQAPDADEDSAAANLPAMGEPPHGEDLLTALDKHLADQKLALAFEKLALASGISGPDLVSSTPLPAPDEDDVPGPRAAPAACENSLVDWHTFPDVRTHVWDRVPAKAWGILLAGLVALSLVTAAVIMKMI